MRNLFLIIASILLLQGSATAGESAYAPAKAASVGNAPIKRVLTFVDAMTQFAPSDDRSSNAEGACIPTGPPWYNILNLADSDGYPYVLAPQGLGAGSTNFYACDDESASAPGTDGDGYYGAWDNDVLTNGAPFGPAFSPTQVGYIKPSGLSWTVVGFSCSRMRGKPSTHYPAGSRTAEYGNTGIGGGPTAHDVDFYVASRDLSQADIDNADKITLSIAATADGTFVSGYDPLSTFEFDAGAFRIGSSASWQETDVITDWPADPGYPDRLWNMHHVCLATIEVSSP